MKIKGIIVSLAIHVIRGDEKQCVVHSRLYMAVMENAFIKSAYDYGVYASLFALEFVMLYEFYVIGKWYYGL